MAIGTTTPMAGAALIRCGQLKTCYNSHPSFFSLSLSVSLSCTSSTRMSFDFIANKRQLVVDNNSRYRRINKHLFVEGKKD